MIKEEKEMDQNFQPIELTKKTIEDYYNYWTTEADPNPTICLSDTECISAFEAGISFSDIHRGESVLIDVFNTLKAGCIEHTEEAVILLDSIYHTQIKDALHFAIRLRKKVEAGLVDRIIKAESPHEKALRVDEIASLLKEEDESKPFAYSFATKFCSMISPDKYPILDAYIAWLLNKYVPDTKGASRFGSYEAFIEAYNKLVSSLGNVSYKKVDVFMWTYGKALNKFAENVAKKDKRPVFKAYVTYKRPNE